MKKLLEWKPFKLILAIGGIYGSYIYYGYELERIYNHNYTGKVDENGHFEKFNFAFSTSLFQNALCFLIAYFVNLMVFKDTKSKIDIKNQLTISFCAYFAVFLATEALVYVSFPVQALMKSSKILSILGVSLLMGHKAEHTNLQYFCGIIITVGIVVFNSALDKAEHKTSNSEKESSFEGVVLVIISLFCDGLLGTKQTAMKKKCNPSQWDQMQSLNKWNFLLGLIIALGSGKLFQFYDFVMRYPACLKELAIISVLGSVGQIFIFYTIYNFSPVFLSIVTTSRKFFTVLVSILAFNHPVNWIQWCAISLVFVGVSLEIFSDKKEKDHKDHKVKVAHEKKDD